MNYEQKKQIFENELKKHEQDCRDLAAWLGDHPEISCHEKESCARVCALLEKEGFAVEREFAGVDHAFLAIRLPEGKHYTHKMAV
ncbi:MAG: hypothetical protein II439_03665, partial [Firmicutes bacterium]|nr:hypothetical protein [Bacillota bacterium]